MLKAIVRISLTNRVLVVLATLAICVYGVVTALRLPIDVLPDLNRPTVTILIEAPGLAPEEVEVQVTYPIETVMNGAAGVERVRSVSGIGLSVVFVEFDWDTDIRYNRQVVQERINQAAERLPEGITPFMAPISSIMGEIMLVGVTGEGISPMELRTLADWTIRPALLAVPGIAQVTVMGGDLKQFQVRADPEKLRIYDLTLQDLEEAVQESNENSGGGFIVGENQELVVRYCSEIQGDQDLIILGIITIQDPNSNLQESPNVSLGLDFTSTWLDMQARKKYDSQGTLNHGLMSLNGVKLCPTATPSASWPAKQVFPLRRFVITSGVVYCSLTAGVRATTAFTVRPH